METTGDHGAHRSPVSARATGKFGDHGGPRETMGEHSMSGTARHGMGIWQGGRPQTGNHGRSECAKKHWARQEHLARREISNGNLRETTVCKGPQGAARATGKMGDQG